MGQPRSTRQDATFHRKAKSRWKESSHKDSSQRSALSREGTAWTPHKRPGSLFIEQGEVIEKIPTHLPACAEGRQGPLAGPSPQPTSDVPAAVFVAAGRHRIAPQRDPTQPTGLGRRGLPRVTPRQSPQRFFALTALPACGRLAPFSVSVRAARPRERSRPAQPKSKFLSPSPGNSGDQAGVSARRAGRISPYCAQIVRR